MSLWADAGDPGARFGLLRKGAEHVAAVQRVKDWTRERFGLVEEDTIVVSEMTRDLPGFPPLQTAIVFWTADGTRHHFTVFKAAREVADGDIPPAWMKDSLALTDGVQCACC